MARRLLLAAGVSMLGTLPYLPAWAQAGATPAPRPTVGDVVIVTATRRSESLQAVPVAVTAVSGQRLAASGVGGAQDLAVKVPTIVFSRTGATNQVFVRGVGTQINALGSDNSVATFVDGVYRSRSRDLAVEFLDVDRVEVLKGPQGTLYGRNATAGALIVVSAIPTFNRLASLEVDAGTFDAFRVTGVADIPLIEDQAAVRVAAQHTRHEGYARNLAGAGAAGRLDDQSSTNARATLRVWPTTSVSVDLRADWFRNEQNGIANKIDSRAPAFARDRLGGRVSADPRTVFLDFTPSLFQETWGLSTVARWTGDSIDVTYQAAYRESSSFDATDTDGTDLPVGFVSTRDDGWAVSHTLVVSAARGPVDWMIGVERFDETVDQTLVTKPPTPDPTFILRFPSIRLENEAVAAFVQLGYKVASRVTARAGLRYAEETKSFVNEGVAGFAPNAPPLLPAFGGSRSWDDLIPKFGVDVTLDDRWLVYASATRGFKSGGFNTSQPGPAFEPESIWSYEIGSKWTSKDRRFRLNAAAFVYDYTDLQVELPSPNGAQVAVENAADARVVGLEVDAAARLENGLSVDLAVSWLPTAEYENYVSADPLRPGPPRDLSGNRLTRAPEVSTSLGLEYRRTLGDLGEASLRVDWSWRSTVEFSQFGSDPANGRPFTDQPAYHLVNASIRWTDQADRISVSIYGRNLGDELYRSGIQVLATDPLIAQFYGPPRTVGAVVSTRF
jgi:iron complex outermembrane recepter protein